MIKSKQSLLQELALLPELAQNKLARTFALHPDIDLSKKEKFFDNVMAFYHLPEVETSELKVPEAEDVKLLEDWIGKDLRIKRVAIKSVRGFPDSPLPFGIDFRNDTHEPQSMIILGGNGCGKSSLYSSLEFAYTKEVSEARLRIIEQLHIGSQWYKEYLGHFHQGFERAYCQIETVDDVFSLQADNIPEAVRHHINPQTHFLSDCDIYEHCKRNFESGKEGSFHQMIAVSLGLKDLLEFEKNIRQFIGYKRRTESDKISVIEKSRDHNTVVLKSSLDTLTQKRAALEVLRQSNDVTPEASFRAELLTLLRKLKDKSLAFSYNLEELVATGQAFQNAFTAYYAVEHKHNGQNMLQFLKLGAGLLRNAANCPLCDSSTKSTTEISDYISQRIAAVESYDDLAKDLNRQSALFFEKLKSLYNNLSLLLAQLEGEWKTSSAHTEFNELTLKANSIIAFTEMTLAHGFFQDIKNEGIDAKEGRSQPTSLSELFQTHQGYMIKGLPEVLQAVNSFLADRRMILETLDQKFSTATTYIDRGAQIAVMTKEIEDLERQIGNLERKLSLDKEALIAIRKQEARFHHLREEARSYVQVLHSRLNIEVQNAFQPVKQTVEEVLKFYLDQDGREVDIKVSIEPEETDSETGETLSEIIVARVIPSDGITPPMPVNRFFNTFHYRLFATMVGISIAIASRIQTRINMPLVIDDIFYASDFENKATIESFLRKIIQIFHQFSPGMPLQIIMFTHDQLIFESAIEIINEVGQDQMAFAKMFPYKEAEDKGNYLNLIYKYPYNLPKSVINTLFENYV